MKTNFVNYLKYYLDNSGASWINFCRGQVANFENADASQPLDLIFSDFPYDKKPFPFDSATLNLLAVDFNNIIISDHAINYLNTDKKYAIFPSTRAIDKLVIDLFNLAMSEILNAIGEIKPDIFQILHLHKLPVRWQGYEDGTKASLTTIKIIAVYFKEILIPALKNIWFQSYDTQYRKISNNREKPLYLCKLLAQTFASKIDAIYIEKSNPFKNKLLLYPLFENHSLALSCAHMLLKIPLEAITKIFTEDLRHLSSPRELKISFWNNIYEALTEVDDQKAGDCRARLLVLISTWEIKNKKVTPSISSLFQATPKPVEVPKEFLILKYPELYKHFLVRDNLHLLGQYAEKKDANHPQDTIVLASFRTAKINLVYLTQETKFLLPKFICLCQPSGTLCASLKQQQMDFESLITFDDMLERIAPPPPVSVVQPKSKWPWR